MNNCLLFKKQKKSGDKSNHTEGGKCLNQVSQNKYVPDTWLVYVLIRS